MTAGDLKQFLNKKVDYYDQPFFIFDYPISIPHFKKTGYRNCRVFCRHLLMGKSHHNYSEIQRTDGDHEYVAT